MFTGLIEAVGEIVSIERTGASARVTVKAGLPAHEIKLGDSIAVNGACLTVVRMGGGSFSFDASPETLECTAFRRLGSGSKVNLERALKLSDRLDGHLVSGHVDCIATIVERRELSGNIIFGFRFPAEYAKYIAAKGSIAIDGISLTVNEAGPDRFTVNIIPHTAEKTNLVAKRVGDEVNIETDLICRYLERLLGGRGGDGGSVSLELLAKAGFL